MSRVTLSGEPWHPKVLVAALPREARRLHARLRGKFLPTNADLTHFEDAFRYGRHLLGELKGSHGACHQRLEHGPSSTEEDAQYFANLESLLDAVQALAAAWLRKATSADLAPQDVDMASRSVEDLAQVVAYLLLLLEQEQESSDA